MYSITGPGRQALADWLTAGSTPPVFESEHILKVFYAEHGSTADVLATLDRLRAWVHELTLHNIEVGSGYLEGSGPYPERLATLVLTGRFLDDYLEMIDRWAAWAGEVADAWPPEPGEAAPDLAGLQATLRQATARAQRWGTGQQAGAGTDESSAPAP